MAASPQQVRVGIRVGIERAPDMIEGKGGAPAGADSPCPNQSVLSMMDRITLMRGAVWSWSA